MSHDSEQVRRLQPVASDLAYLEKHNPLTHEQRQIICFFELELIAAILQDDVTHYSVLRYRFVQYLKQFGLRTFTL